MKNYFLSVRPFFNGKPVRLEELDGEMKAYVGDILKALNINESVEEVLKNVPSENISKHGNIRKKSFVGPDIARDISKRSPNGVDFDEWFANIRRQLEEGEVLEETKAEKDSYNTDLLEELLRRQNLILDNQIKMREDIQDIKKWIAAMANLSQFNE